MGGGGVAHAAALGLTPTDMPGATTDVVAGEGLESAAVGAAAEDEAPVVAVVVAVAAAADAAAAVAVSLTEAVGERRSPPEAIAEGRRSDLEPVPPISPEGELR